jgi:1,4-alpha-glucan branching enzyme
MRQAVPVVPIEEFGVIRLSKVAKTSDVKITFSLPTEDPAGPVSVVGDFNDWIPGKHVLAKRANGTRSVAITVPAGAKYRFRYLGENGHWFDEPQVERDGDAGLLVT